jgi:hypothetical protein
MFRTALSALHCSRPPDSLDRARKPGAEAQKLNFTPAWNWNGLYASRGVLNPKMGFEGRLSVTKNKRAASPARFTRTYHFFSLTY